MGCLHFIPMDMNGEDEEGRIAEIAETLRQRRDDILRKISKQDVVNAVAGVFQSWTNDILWRETLEAGYSSTGFHPNTLHQGLSRSFANWDAFSLFQLMNTEFGEDWPNNPLAYFPENAKLHLIISSGNLPLPGLWAMACSLLAGLSCIVSSSGRDFYFPLWFARRLQTLRPDLAKCVAVLALQNKDAGTKTLLKTADAVSVYGRNETVEKIKYCFPEKHKIFFGHGHRTSAVLLAKDEIRLETAKLLAFDAAMWDQQGCMSPTVAFIEDNSAMSHNCFIKAVAKEFESLRSKMPRANLTHEEHSAIQEARGFWGLSSSSLAVLESPGGTDWTLVYENSAHFPISPLNRFLFVKPFRNWEEVLSLFSNIPISTLAFGPESLSGNSDWNPASMARAIGAKRICAIGSMQTPPAIWPHDGLPNLKRFFPSK